MRTAGGCDGWVITGGNWGGCVHGTDAKQGHHTSGRRRPAVLVPRPLEGNDGCRVQTRAEYARRASTARCLQLSSWLIPTRVLPNLGQLR